MFETLFASRGLRIESQDISVIGGVTFTPGTGDVKIGPNRVLTTADNPGGGTEFFSGVCTVSLIGTSPVLNTTTINPGGQVAPTAFPFTFSRTGRTGHLYIPAFTCTLTSGMANAVRFQNFSPALPLSLGSNIFRSLVQVSGVPAISPVVNQKSLFTNATVGSASLIIYGDTTGYTTNLGADGFIIPYITNQ